ncbi:MAG: FMN-binding negative transcriptional regulator [Pseudomonadota bacterium]
MYAPSAFQVKDHEKLLALIQAHPLATLACNGEAGPVIAHVPLVAEIQAGKIHALVGHVARANPIWQSAKGALGVAVFSGPDAYVSPGYYPSKQAHGKVVPTWNYVRVEARGRFTIESEPVKMRAYIDPPTDHMEQPRRDSWSTKDAPDAYINQLSQAIVGVRLDIVQIEGVWKLSQNKSQADFAGVVQGLEADNIDQVANAMINAKKRDKYR